MVAGSGRIDSIAGRWLDVLAKFFTIRKDRGIYDRNKERTAGVAMMKLLDEFNGDAVTDAIGMAAICIATVVILWLPALLAG